MQSSSQGRYQGYQGYQGYPYANPVVTDIPTVDAKTAARWANLPRRPVGQVPGPVRNTPELSNLAGSSRDPQQPQASRDAVPPKEDIDANPVVYIDLPEAGSEVSQSIGTPSNDEPEFVQDTILFDPFENRRINVPKEDSSSNRSSTSESTHSGGFAQYIRPIPPSTLNLASPGSSGVQSPASTSRSTPAIPAFMTKESLVYGGDGLDGFPMSPIPISEFPEPPPTYTETVTSPMAEQPRQEPPPPRTQVIVPNVQSPVVQVDDRYFDRKNLTCQHCGLRVNTLVIKEVGYMTHLVACIILIVCIPFVIIAYFTDYFKHKMHYCPNCNRKIGYQTPFGSKINYVP